MRDMARCLYYIPPPLPHTYTHLHVVGWFLGYCGQSASVMPEFFHLLLLLFHFMTVLLCKQAPAQAQTSFWGPMPDLPDLGVPTPVPDKRIQLATKGGETAGLQRLQQWLWETKGLSKYVGTTDWGTPAKCSLGPDSTTKLSPWLAHGCLSVRLVYQEVVRYEVSLPAGLGREASTQFSSCVQPQPPVGPVPPPPPPPRPPL